MPQLKQELSREPTSGEIATRLQVDVVHVEQAAAARGYFRLLSLDQPIDTVGDLKLADVVACGEDQTLLKFEQIPRCPL